MDPFSDLPTGESADPAGVTERPGGPSGRSVLRTGRPVRPGPPDSPRRRRELILSLACGLIDDRTEVGGAFADSVTATMAIMMAAVPPKERTVFVLHDAFGMSYSEISEVLAVHEEQVRDLHQWARRRVRQRTDGAPASGSVERRLMDSCMSRDVNGLASLLDAEVRLDLYHAGTREGVAGRAEGRERVARLIMEYCESRRLREPFHVFRSGDLGILWSSADSPIGALVLETENAVISVVTAISGHGGAAARERRHDNPMPERRLPRQQ